MMVYDKKTESVYINDGQIWLKIESLFHLKYNDIQLIMNVWLKESYKLEEVTPHSFISDNPKRWKRIKKFD